MPSRSRTEQTERSGVIAVARVFNDEFGWIFREQGASDYGIDAHVEIVHNGQLTGKLIALQIKSGQSYFRRRYGNVIFRGKINHLQYWTRYLLPVLIILHNPKSGLTLWQHISVDSVDVKHDGWSIIIPDTNILNAAAATTLMELGEINVNFPGPGLSISTDHMGAISSLTLYPHFDIYRRAVEFQKGKDLTTIEDITHLYSFDRQLRIHVLEGLERIEMEIKTMLFGEISKIIDVNKRTRS